MKLKTGWEAWTYLAFLIHKENNCLFNKSNKNFEGECAIIFNSIVFTISYLFVKLCSIIIISLM